MGDFDLKKNNLTKEDINEFAKLTASSADDCVREIDELIEAKGAKEKELSALTEAEESFSVEDKIRSKRSKDKLRKEISDLDRNIETVTARGLILERSCDVNQEVASQLEGKEVNYRTMRRLADKTDIEDDVKDLRRRLASKERRTAAASGLKQSSKVKKLVRWLLAIATLVIIILLLLRKCGGVGNIKHTIYKVIGLEKGDGAGDSGTSERVKLGIGSDSSGDGGSGGPKSSRSVYKVDDEEQPDDETGEGTSEYNKLGFGRVGGASDDTGDDGDGTDGADGTK
ncbi:MAG TPA: hypothetical protein DCO86_05455, partial [Spirochaetaceae bacterium]|nr:hypothetical protein [Spirochaetaceae bacterium]